MTLDVSTLCAAVFFHLFVGLAALPKTSANVRGVLITS